uniref:Hydin adenylate kinase-like domain-containing protein n=1 Tax=Neolamprologus brichardi TaxID=32507 RepID=A0A3Q4HS25_NEOBR
MYWKVDTSQPTAKLCKGGTLPDQSFLPPIFTPKQRDDARRGSSLPSSREKLMVSLRPSRLELFPGGSADMVLTVSADSPKVVRERLVCYAIVGQQGYQEKIMSVDITCRFVAPLLSISSKQLNFYIKKVSLDVRPLYEKLILKNVSSLPVSMKLSLIEPFSLCEAPGEHSTATTKSVVLGDKCEAELWVCFNPAFYKDRVSHNVDEYLEVHYLGHPQQDVVDLHAEVHYPNLDFPSTTVDFDCVLNCTETHKVMTITNCSLLPVSYYWTFLDDHINSRYSHTESGQTALEHGGDVTTLRSLLPEHLLVDILAERFQLSDCYHGIVIDGLDSAYTRVPVSTLQVVLKALSSRKHIYLVNLSDSYTALKARERAQSEAEGKIFTDRNSYTSSFHRSFIFIKLLIMFLLKMELFFHKFKMNS